MFRLFATVFLCFFISLNANCAVVGGIQKTEHLKNYNQIIDSQTGKGIPQAKVSAPALKFVTITDNDGRFNLKTDINAPTILSVQKDGYKPFSMTIDKTGRTPLIIGIEKNAPTDIVVETDMIHLGDNSYSINSANASDFSSISKEQNAYLIIGSIIGIDTLTARQAGQSKVQTTFASPAEVFCNGNKICELQINGDHQQILLPKGVLKTGNKNTITVKAGKNLFQTAYIDYDDIEFTNLSVEIK